MHLSREEYSEFVCGCGAAIINVGITFPINKIIFRQVFILKKLNFSAFCILFELELKL